MMRARRLAATTSFVTTLALAWPIVGATPATAAGGGCPPPASGFVRWDVTTEPYQADDASDANGNGWVCARALPQTFVFDGETFPIYNFIDDHIPVDLPAG
jgi:hypothetical protein